MHISIYTFSTEEAWEFPLEARRRAALCSAADSAATAANAGGRSSSSLWLLMKKWKSCYHKFLKISLILTLSFYNIWVYNICSEYALQPPRAILQQRAKTADKS